MRLKGRLTARGVALVLLLGLAATAAWDGAKRRPVEASQGHALNGLPGRADSDDGLLTVAQFNIRGGVGTDGQLDLDRTALCLKGIEVAGLNEVRAGDWLGFEPSQAQVLAERHGLAWLFAPSERRWWHEHFGNAVLSALPAAAWRSEPLPRSGLPEGDSRSGRSLASVLIPWRGEQVTVLVTHVAPDGDRDAQLTFLAERFAATPAPKILLGDLNARADHPVLAAWARDPHLAMTDGGAPAGIDWIVAEGFTIDRAWSCEVGASDHPLIGAALWPHF